MNVRNVTGYGGFGFTRGRWIAAILAVTAVCWLVTDVASAVIDGGATPVTPAAAPSALVAPAPVRPVW